MNFQIKSKKLGRTLTFSVPGETYVYVDINDREGSLGKQICHGGALSGSTLCAGKNNEEAFKRMCRNWYRSFLRLNKEQLEQDTKLTWIN